MIYLITGTDIQKVRQRVREVTATLHKKRPDALYMRITADQYANDTLQSLVGAQGLFSPKLIVELDGIIEGHEEDIIPLIEELEKSDNVFICVEEMVEGEMGEKLSFSAHTTERYDAPIKEKEPTLFTLTDAVGARDKKKLWVEYRLALERGGVPEEIHGMLFWQIKSMILASTCTEKDSTLKPFVYKKSKAAAKNYTPEELINHSRKLVTLYHEARRTGPDLATALEAWMLEL